MEAKPIEYSNHQSKGCAGTPNPKEWKWVKEMTSFSSDLGSNLILSGTLHLIMSVASGITAFSRSSSNALWSTNNFVHYVVMVLAGGVGGAKGIVGWRAKALGWKEEIRGGNVDDHKRQQISVEPPHDPRPLTHLRGWAVQLRLITSMQQSTR